MKIYDTHTHSYYSPDSEADILEHVRYAKQMGRDRIFVSDHLDYRGGERTNMYYDVQEFFAEVDKLNHHQNDVKICKSIELGFDEASLQLMHATVSNKSFDMVLLSVHAIASQSIFQQAKTCDSEEKAHALLDRVLDQSLLALEKFQDFDTFTHFDYTSRYLAYPALFYPKHMTKVDAFLKRLITQEKCLEVNTKAFQSDVFSGPHPQKEILERYYALGGRKVTLGSDAHTTYAMYSHFEESCRMLRAIGFTEVYYFERRQPRTQLI